MSGFSTGVAVTGVGVLGSFGVGMEELARSVVAGSHSLQDMGGLSSLGDVGIAPAFDAVVGVYPGALSLPESCPPRFRTRQLGMAWECLKQLEGELRSAVGTYGARRVGLVVGTSTGGVLASERAFSALKSNGSLPDDYSYEDGHAFDGMPRWLAQHQGVHGPVYVVSVACASGTKAILAARRLILSGICDAVLTGGVDSICSLTLHGFHSLGLLSKDRSTPFQHSAGMNVAEGAAWLLLEREARPGSRCFGYVAGGGETSDAYSMTTPKPDGEGARSAMEGALADAGLSAQGLTYINAHGTGTKANDEMEALAIRRLWPDVPVFSSKALHGHQLGATGATESAVALVVLSGTQHSPLLGRCPTGAELGLAVEPRSERTQGRSTQSTALSNSFAFGGANATIAVTREPVTGRVAQVVPRPWLRVAGTAVWAEGYPSLVALAGMRRFPGESRPRAALLSARERGRASTNTLLFAELLGQLSLEAEQLETVAIIYVSAYGQAQVTVDLLELHYRAQESPLRFQMSVHNAAQGMLSISTRNKGFSTSLSAGRAGVAAGLLEAWALIQTRKARRVAVLWADEAPPSLLAPDGYAAAGAGVLLELPNNLETEQQGGAPAVELSRPELETGDMAPAALPDQLMRSPSSFALRLLLAINARKTGHLAVSPSDGPTGESWSCAIRAEYV